MPVSIAPAHNSADVAYSTKETVVTFNDISPGRYKVLRVFAEIFQRHLERIPHPDSYMVRFEGKVDHPPDPGDACGKE